MKNRYLVIGGNGLVGKKLSVLLGSKELPFYRTTHRNTLPGSIVCDVLQQDDLRRAFETAKPTVVINATNLAGGVDFCENNPDQAKAFHRQANIHLGELCRDFGAKMVLLSTDYVFDGKNPPYAENDEVHPLNVYGREKLAAEQWLQKNLTDYLIVRTTNVFGWDPHTKTPNFLMALYFKLSQGEKAGAPSFLWGNPTHVGQLCETIIELCEKGKAGVYHVVGSSFINRYEWAKLFCKALHFDEHLLNELKEKPTNIAPRPFESNLRTAKVQAECRTQPEDVATALQRFINEMEPDGH